MSEALQWEKMTEEERSYVRERLILPKNLPWANDVVRSWFKAARVFLGEK